MGYPPPPLPPHGSLLSMNKDTKLTHSRTRIRTSKNISLHDLRISLKEVWAGASCSDLPRLSLIGAGGSVPLVRQGALPISAPAFVHGRRLLPVLPVLPVSVVCPVLAPFLLGRRALSFAGVR